MTYAIRIENLGKQYRLNHDQPRAEYETLRETIGRMATAPIRRLRNGTQPGRTEQFWALRDVTFDVQHGEVLGIIGRNGAGKSTILKILSQITKPTTGRVRLYGRVASLLEVGTGFHPELTGRENVFLNGSILGMSAAEIVRKFDEIVEFSGVEKFLDTPIKRYSSGMKVRLAFSVAAHLDPEILLVDEVLAVGDMEFQRRCLGKMHAVSRSGRTVLFVSHNLAAIESLCSRAIVLDFGSVEHDGDVSSAITRYAGRFQELTKIEVAHRTDRKGDGSTRVTAIRLEDENGFCTDTLPMGAGFRIVIEYERSTEPSVPVVGVVFSTLSGQRLFRLTSHDQGADLRLTRQRGAIICEVASMPLLPGKFLLTVVIADRAGHLHDYLDAVTSLEITPSDVFGNGRIPNGPGDLIFVPSRWGLA